MENREVRMAARSFRDLPVWQQAHAFVLNLYRFTDSFPRHEQCGLVSQMRRAAVSVPANIVEGFRKRGRADKARYLNIAQASLAETEYYLILADGLGYGDTVQLIGRVDEISRLLTSYLKAVIASVT